MGRQKKMGREPQTDIDVREPKKDDGGREKEKFKARAGKICYPRTGLLEKFSLGSIIPPIQKIGLESLNIDAIIEVYHCWPAESYHDLQ